MRNIIIFVLLTASVTLTKAQQISYFCQGGAAKNLQIAACTGGTAPYTYKWTSPTAVVTNSNSITINNISQAGVWTWECRDAGGCTAIGSHEVIFEPTPVFNINAINICLNASLIVTAVGVPSGYTYSWNFGSGAVPATSITPSTSVLWNTIGSKTITLTIEKIFDGTACDATCSWVQTTTITVGSGNITGTSSCN